MVPKPANASSGIKGPAQRWEVCCTACTLLFWFNNYNANLWPKVFLLFFSFLHWYIWFFRLFLLHHHDQTMNHHHTLHHEHGWHNRTTKWPSDEGCNWGARDATHCKPQVYFLFFLFLFFSIIAVCKKLVKTQINTKSAHWGMKFATAIYWELLTQSSWSLLQRTHLPPPQGLVLSFPPISSHYLFQKTQPQNTCPLHSADNYSRTSVLILSKLSQFILLTYRQGLIHVHIYFL